MKVPLVDLQKQYAPLKEEILNGFSQVLDGMHLFLGENVQKLESEFSKFCGAKHGIGISDGTAALNIILRAMDIGPGDEVITVSHTFIATVEAIMLTGAKPVFVDIDPSSYLMDISKVEAKITSNTKAIIPVHLYGQTVDMDPLKEIAVRHGLRIVEDACQAHGALYKGKMAGTLGDAAGFSFYYSKNLGAYGEAGFITTDDPELATRIRKIRDHGSAIRYEHDTLGFNGRLDEMQAVVLRIKLPHLASWNQNRRNNAQIYNDLLKRTPVVTPVECRNNTHVYHLYVIETPRRDELMASLNKLGISTGIHYPIPVHLQKSMGAYGFKRGDLPVTEQVVSKILSLPMHPELNSEQISFIADSIHDYFQ